MIVRGFRMKDDFINAIYNWFVKNKKTIRRRAIIAVIVCPLIIWGLYFIGRFIWGIPTDITADGILGYSAAIISSFATVFLGFITLSLSKRANKINDDLLAVQKDQYLLETRPFIMLTDWKAFGHEYNNIVFTPDKIYLCIDSLEESQREVSCLSLFITNTTRSYLQANYGSGEYIKDEVKHHFAKSAANQYNTKLLLAPGETKEIVLYGGVGLFSSIRGENITFTFYLENHLAERYIEQVVTTIVMYSDPFEQGIGDWYAMLEFTNYTVEKIL